MAAPGTGAGPRGQQSARPADPGARTELSRLEGDQPDDLEVETDDPEMAELRAYAAEVVRAGGGIPRRSGYLPRLEPGRPALALNMVPLLSERWWQLTSWVRLRPMRSLALAVAGSGAVAAALFFLLPGQSSLELEAARPGLIVVAAAPLPPPPTASTSELMLPAAAPVLPANKLAVPPRNVPAEQAAEKLKTSTALRLLAQRTPAKTEARSPTKRADKVAQRRGGRRLAAATAGRGKEGKEVGTAAHAKRGPALDKRAIIEGMTGIQPLVRQCYREHKVRGVANVGVQVVPSGKVKRVTVAGPLAKTRTGACVKAAVKTAQFRGGGSASFHYPLVLQ